MRRIETIEAQIVDLRQQLGTQGSDSPRYPAESLPTPPAKKRILFLAANPSETDRLRLDKEFSEVQAKLRGAQGRDRFELISCPAVTPKTLQQAMLDYRPAIVHFGGHSVREGLLLEGGDQGVFSPARAIADLLRLGREYVECAVLNACYSEDLALDIIAHIPYAIGMGDTVEDGAAQDFSGGFYRALFAGESYERAFEYGKNAIALENRTGDWIPVLKKRDKV